MEELNSQQIENKKEQILYGNNVDIAPDVIRPKTAAETMAKPITNNFQSSGAGISPVGSFNSLNFQSNSNGWGFGSNGDAQINGNHQVSTSFTPVLRLKGLTIYVSDGTSPHTVLDGATGDLCLNCGTGKAFTCAGGTSWVQL